MFVFLIHFFQKCKKNKQKNDQKLKEVVGIKRKGFFKKKFDKNINTCIDHRRFKALQISQAGVAFDEAKLKITLTP